MIVLDTHALIWWVNGDALLVQSAKSAIEDTLTSGGRVLVSAISAWEIAMLAQRGRIELAMSLAEWLRVVDSIEGVDFVPITAQVRSPDEAQRNPG